MTPTICGRCGTPRDPADNFCRRCGHQLTIDLTPAAPGLPATRPSSLPVRSPVVSRSLVGSVAVLAIGTGLEWVARRFAGTAARGAARAAGRALTRQDRLPTTRTRNAQPDSVSVDELIYVRRVELRR